MDRPRSTRPRPSVSTPSVAPSRRARASRSIIKKLDVGTNRVLGVIRKSARETRVEPVDRRSKDMLLVPQAQSGDLRDGDRSINLREVTANSRHWENGQWVEGPALSHKQVFDFEGVGQKNMYLMYRSWPRPRPG